MSTCKLFDLRLVGGEYRKLLRISSDVYRKAVGRLDIHLGSDIPDLCYQLDHGRHFGFCLLVDECVVTGRKRREHDRLPGAGIRRSVQFARDTRQLLPQLLGEVWHEWMEHSQCLLENGQNPGPSVG